MSSASNQVRFSLLFISSVFSAIVGLICMFNGYFLDMQFGEAKLLKTVAFVTITIVCVALLLIGPSLKNIIAALCDQHFLLKSVANSSLFVSLSALLFLIKYPRFDIHSEYRRYCLEEEENKYSLGSQYNFLSAGAFALLDVVIASQRHQPAELGSFSILLELVSKSSMEIPGTDGPNLWYMLGAVLYGFGLIFFRCWAEANSSRGSRDNYEVANTVEGGRGHAKRASWIDLSRRNLGLFSATVGIVCLFLSPFSKDQLGRDLANTKGMCFIILSLLLVYFMPEIPKLVDVLVKSFHKHVVVKVLVNFSLLVIFSLLSFLSKYPRFKIRSRYSESCSAQNMEKISNGRKFDLYAAAAFSVLAMTTPSKTRKQQPMELGISSFLLRFIMDTSIEILGLNTDQGPWYMVGASIFCAVLIFVMCYVDFNTQNPQERYHGLREILVIPNRNRGEGSNETSSVASRKFSTGNSDDDGNYVIKGGPMDKINEDAAMELRNRRIRYVANFLAKKMINSGPHFRLSRVVMREDGLDKLERVRQMLQEVSSVSEDHHVHPKKISTPSKQNMEEKRREELRRWLNRKTLEQLLMPEGSHKMKRRVGKNSEDRRADIKRGHVKNSIVGKRSMGNNGGDTRAFDAGRKAR